MSFDIFSTNQKLPKHELLPDSGHFACFENVPIAAGHCKQLARRTSAGPSVELLKSCKNDTSSTAFGFLRDWATRTGPMMASAQGLELGPRRDKKEITEFALSGNVICILLGVE